MPLYNNQQNYATLGMQAHQGAASTAANMRPGTTTKQNVSPLSSMAMGGLMGAQLAGTEVGAGALADMHRKHLEALRVEQASLRR